MLSFFPRGVLDEILNLIESVSEEFPSYSYMELAAKTLTYIRYGALYYPNGKKMCEAQNFLKSPCKVE